mmetsp:Transcript_59329/g.67519  ORF Transcript_59329/g.67519 Transcript_59329/m.67519 type:complete len:424 (-) Transcript_59329:180-1451(-)
MKYKFPHLYRKVWHFLEEEEQFCTNATKYFLATSPFQLYVYYGNPIILILITVHQYSLRQRLVTIWVGLICILWVLFHLVLAVNLVQSEAQVTVMIAVASFFSVFSSLGPITHIARIMRDKFIWRVFYIVFIFQSLLIGGFVFSLRAVIADGTTSKGIVHMTIFLLPVILTLLQHLIVTILATRSYIDTIDEIHKHYLSRFLIVTFESLKCSVLVHTFEEDKPAEFCMTLTLYISVETIYRAKVIQWLVKKLRRVFPLSKDVSTHPTIEVSHVAERGKVEVQKFKSAGPVLRREIFEAFFHGCKYDTQYTPLLILIFVRVCDWMPLIAAGNHLNTQGKPDLDFWLPIWAYVGMFFMWALADIVSNALIWFNSGRCISGRTIPNLKHSILVRFLTIGLAMAFVTCESVVFGNYKFHYKSPPSQD